ncbi:DNA-binding transcriptional regulator, XRE family [Deinococcus hopiensis KR-140]|uniref:DNA-binding transcriptional regulator, XRE family n=1 Tax=Deinococcus hopiensis KR-140 TaxID=695939 RepID=A0A1W1VIU2_9DEIO|nr:DNA-binding transcriptional regulator, XRE family [Deinococcus hopiensis KR-140]
MRWKVKEFLDSNNKTAYALWKASGLSRTTTYAIAQGDMEGVQFDTLSKLVEGLEKLTGKRVEIGDLLEVVRP